MRNSNIHIKKISIAVLAATLIVQSCGIPKLSNKKKDYAVPSSYNTSTDTISSGKSLVKQFFKDQNLVALIDTAFKNNQELNMIMQEINISQNEIQARKGEYLPFLHVGGGMGMDRVSKYTRNGAVEENLDVAPNKAFPDPLGDFAFVGNVSWEVDIWKKLRNARKSAALRYLGTIEGMKFMKTQMVAEIAMSYYELIALDNRLSTLQQYISIQQNALEIVRLQKIAGMVTELAVKKFEAEVAKNKGLQYYIEQQIIVAENRINFLVGRIPEPVARNSANFINMVPDTIYSGVPAQLLENRPDIQQATLNLAAAEIDVKVAKANFYPSMRITAGLGLQAFNPAYFAKMPQSILYNLAGDLVGPVINRNAIMANYKNSNARQIRSVYNYQRSVLNAYIEVVNQLSNISNLKQSYSYRKQQVDALTESITISTSLFKTARADYMEVLMTQRDALDARFDLIETKLHQLQAVVKTYQALGGGWR